MSPRFVNLPEINGWANFFLSVSEEQEHSQIEFTAVSSTVVVNMAESYQYNTMKWFYQIDPSQNATLDCSHLYCIILSCFNFLLFFSFRWFEKIGNIFQQKMEKNDNAPIFYYQHLDIFNEWMQLHFFHKWFMKSSL